jgi:hypothetical protein
MNFEVTDPEYHTYFHSMEYISLAWSEIELTRMLECIEREPIEPIRFQTLQILELFSTMRH